MSKDKKELTDLQKRFLSCFLDEEHKGNIRSAMRAAGYNDSTSVANVVEALHEEMTEAALKVIGANSMKAAFGMLGILDDPESLGAANKIKAAKEILDRAGVKQRDEDTNIQVHKGGIVILPAKGSFKSEDEE